jgi:hypothetical protein
LRDAKRAAGDRFVRSAIDPITLTPLVALQELACALPPSVGASVGISAFLNDVP